MQTSIQFQINYFSYLRIKTLNIEYTSKKKQFSKLKTSCFIKIFKFIKKLFLNSKTRIGMIVLKEIYSFKNLKAFFDIFFQKGKFKS
jgi:hypothetical protein